MSWAAGGSAASGGRPDVMVEFMARILFFLPLDETATDGNT
jgi:hypothetical protein